MSSFTVAELQNWEPNAAERVQTQAEERQYRRGYWAAAYDVLEMLLAGATVRQVAEWVNAQLLDWAYRDSCDEIVYPPKLAGNNDKQPS